MKKLISILFLILFSTAVYAEIISDQTSDTTPAAADLMVAELADNSDYIYFAIGMESRLWTNG